MKTSKYKSNKRKLTKRKLTSLQSGGKITIGNKHFNQQPMSIKNLVSGKTKYRKHYRKLKGGFVRSNIVMTSRDINMR